MDQGSAMARGQIVDHHRRDEMNAQLVGPFSPFLFA